MATGNMHRKFREVCDRTDRQTDTLIAILRTPPDGDEAIICMRCGKSVAEPCALAPYCR